MDREPASILASGTPVGGYRIERLLGRGGMGEVYLATDTRLHRPVALKVLPADLAADADRRTRFEREARMAAALRHPHICTIFEVGDAEGRSFIAMEYVEGTTLQDRVRVDLFSVKESVDIAIQIADALDEARERGVVHRDLKSANIMLTPRGDVKVLDFGLAKQVDDLRAAEATTAAGLTGAGVVIGTVAYMSPEQALGQPLDHRSDLFSFGVVLYELLTGRLPFSGKTSMELFSAILHSTPAPIPRFNEAVPDPLVRVVGKFLEKDREARYQSAREVVTDLRKIREEGATASALSATRAPRTTARAWAAIGAVVVIVIAVTLTIILTNGGPSAPRGEATSLLVLPADFHRPPQLEWMKEGVPNTLSQSLTQIDGLEIKSTPKTQEWEAVKKDTQRVLRAYGVSLFVRAVVHAEPGKLNVSLKLTEAGSNRFLWGHDYAGTPENYTSFLSDAADRMRQALRANTSKGASASLTANNDAELAFREGEYFWNRYNNLHERQDFDLALAKLTRALELDPTLADAAAEIAFLYGFRIESGDSASSMLPLLHSWAERARRISDQSGLAWAASAATELYAEKPDVSRVLEYSLRGAYRAPRVAIVQGGVAFGAPLEVSLAAGRESHRLDPLYGSGTTNLAFYLFLANRSQDALAVLDDMPGDATFVLPNRIEELADLGRTDEASRLLTQLTAQADKMPALIPLLSEYQVIAHRRDPRADVVLKRVLHELESAPGYLGCGAVGDVLPFLSRYGRVDAALRLLRFCADRDWLPPFDWLATDRRLAALREDPGFAPLLSRAQTQFVAAMRIFDEADRRGELPKYLVEPLAGLHKRFPAGSGR